MPSLCHRGPRNSSAREIPGAPGPTLLTVPNGPSDGDFQAPASPIESVTSKSANNISAAKFSFKGPRSPMFSNVARTPTKAMQASKVVFNIAMGKLSKSSGSFNFKKKSDSQNLNLNSDVDGNNQVQNQSVKLNENSVKESTVTVTEVKNSDGNNAAANKLKSNNLKFDFDDKIDHYDTTNEPNDSVHTLKPDSDMSTEQKEKVPAIESLNLNPSRVSFKFPSVSEVSDDLTNTGKDINCDCTITNNVVTPKGGICKNLKSSTSETSKTVTLKSNLNTNSKSMSSPTMSTVFSDFLRDSTQHCDPTFSRSTLTPEQIKVEIMPYINPTTNMQNRQALIKFVELLGNGVIVESLLCKLIERGVVELGIEVVDSVDANDHGEDQNDAENSGDSNSMTNHFKNSNIANHSCNKSSMSSAFKSLMTGSSNRNSGDHHGSNSRKVSRVSSVTSRMSHRSLKKHSYASSKGNRSISIYSSRKESMFSMFGSATSEKSSGCNGNFCTKKNSSEVSSNNLNNHGTITGLTVTESNTKANSADASCNILLNDQFNLLTQTLRNKSECLEFISCLLVHYLYEFHNGPDYVSYNFLKNNNFDVAKAVEAFESAAIWYWVDLWEKDEKTSPAILSAKRLLSMDSRKYSDERKKELKPNQIWNPLCIKNNEGLENSGENGFMQYRVEDEEGISKTEWINSNCNNMGQNQIENSQTHRPQSPSGHVVDVEAIQIRLARPINLNDNHDDTGTVQNNVNDQNSISNSNQNQDNITSSTAEPTLNENSMTVTNSNDSQSQSEEFQDSSEENSDSLNMNKITLRSYGAQCLRFNSPTMVPSDGDKVMYGRASRWNSESTCSSENGNATTTAVVTIDSNTSTGPSSSTKVTTSTLTSLHYPVIPNDFYSLLYSTTEEQNKKNCIDLKNSNSTNNNSSFKLTLPYLLRLITSPIPHTEFCPYSYVSTWDEWNHVCDIFWVVGPPYCHVRNIYLSSNMDWLEMCQCKAVVQYFHGYLGGPMMRLGMSGIQKSVAIMRLRRWQIIRELGSTGCIFCLDCQDTGVMTVSKIMASSKRYLTAVREINKHFPGGMVRTLMYNLSPSAQVLMNVLAGLMLNSESRSRIKWCGGYPTSKMLKEWGVSLHQFKQLEGEVKGKSNGFKNLGVTLPKGESIELTGKFKGFGELAGKQWEK